MPALPAPIGPVRFRHFGGDDDFPGMVSVLDAAKRADGVDRTDTVETMRNAYANLNNCDLDTDLLIAETDDGIVGYFRVTWWTEEATRVRVLVHVGWVHPAVRGIGVGTTMLEWSEARLREIAAEKPYDDGPTVFESWFDDGEVARRGALEAACYAPTEMYAEMTRSLDEPIPDLPLPDGLELRPMSIDDARRVWEADQEAFRDHVGYSPGTENDYREFLGGHYCKDPSLWKVAFDGDQIVGMVLNYIDHDSNEEYARKRGYTESISVQRSWRGKGVARSLIAESMRMFGDMGMTEVALGVHTTNPTGAFRLYEGLGYKVVATSREMRKAF
jgi:ribosomal protein S18 acetylase RimI-like enzyme